MKTSLWTPGSGIDTVLQAPVALRSKKGMALADLASLGILPGVSGGANGTHTAADVVTQTADGRDLNVIWTEFMDLLNAVNGGRQALIRFLSFGVTQPQELVPQQGTGVNFEPSSEFGVPVGSRIQPTYFNMGYTFQWWDLAARYTWQYLADATTAMVESVANASVEAYYRLQLFEVLKCIFNPTNLTTTINQASVNVYKFYNNDGTTPPSYKSNTFTNTHQHYRTTGAATINAGDFDEIISDFESHGYSLANGYRTVIMVHSSLVSTIRAFKSVANGGTGTYDFIPAQGQPGTILNVTQQVVGAGQAAATLDGLQVVGSYGPAFIVVDDWLPSTHFFGFTTGGSESINNPVGIRQHASQSLQGLRLIKGRVPDYPLIDSYWAVGFGTGIRQRGAGMVMEITTNASYTVPAIYA
jgi:hypothetical protein